MNKNNFLNYIKGKSINYLKSFGTFYQDYSQKNISNAIIFTAR